MEQSRKQIARATDLRRRTEQWLRVRSGVDSPRSGDPDVLGLVQELQMFQLELEAQNAELRRVRDEAEAARTRFRNLYEFAPVGFVGLDADGIVLEVNSAAVGLLGAEKSELIGATLSEFMPEPDHDQLLLHCREALSADTPRVCEATITRRDGQRLYLELQVVAIALAEEGGRQCLVSLMNISRRKQAQMALRESEERYRLLFERLSEGCSIHEIICDDRGRPCDYRFLDVNPEFERMTGLQRCDIIGRTVLEVMPNTEHEWIETYGRVALTGEPVHFERYSRELDRCYHVFAYRPAPGRFACLFLDITERRRTEEEQEMMVRILGMLDSPGSLRDLMRELAAYLSSQSGCTAVGIRLRDGDDYPYYETSGFPDEFVRAESSLCLQDPQGAPVRDSTGNPVLECMCGNILCGRFDPAQPFFTANGSFWANSTSRLLASTSEADRQARTRNRCNGEGYESVALIPLRAGGETFGLLQFNDRRENRFSPQRIAFFERVAANLAMGLAQRKAEQALQESERRFRLAMDAADEGLWDWNLTDSRIYRSPRFYSMLGYGPGDISESFQGWVELVHPDDHGATLAVLEDYFQGRRPNFDVEFRMKSRQGGWRWIRSRGKIVERDADGRPSRMIGTHLDVTEARQAESRNIDLVEQLRQSQKMQAIGLLAGGVAHNFNNLLLAISGNAEVLAEALSRPAEEARQLGLHSVEQLKRAVQMGTALTQRLQAFCRKQVINPVTLNAAEAIRGMAEMLGPVIGPGVDLYIDTPGEVGFIHVDPGQIEEALLSLAINARDAMPGGGRLSLRTGRVAIDAATAREDLPPGDYVVISVQDTGVGMDEQIRGRLFEPFFTTKPLGQGTGLGLATVYGFVKQAGGCIEVDTAPGAGTTFRLLIPAASPPAEPGQAKLASAHPQVLRRQVLLCEDDSLIRELIARYLSSHGFEVIEAADAETALREAARRSGPIDVLVTDIHMGGMSGLELARKLKERCPAMQCVVTSGHPESLSADQEALGPGLTFLGKPFQMSALLSAIRKPPAGA